MCVRVSEIMNTRIMHHRFQIFTYFNCISNKHYLIRYIRREKQISDTKMELAQSQKIRLQESCDHLQRKLTDTEKMLAEERERNTMNMKSAEEHATILAKV